MWIFLSDSFVSIVEHRDDPTKVMLRARRAGDLQRFFKHAAKAPKVVKTDKADYAFRAVADREEVAALVARHVMDVDYDNFKNSVRDDQRHAVYLDIWTVLYRWQRRTIGRGRKHLSSFLDWRGGLS